MRFYEAHEPYYALMKAIDKDEAIKLYTEYIADDNGTLKDEIKEVGRDYAFVRYKRSMSKEVPISGIINLFQSEETMILLGALL